MNNKQMLQAIQTAEYRATANSLKEVNEEVAKLGELIKTLYDGYTPTWHYQTGKTGYECSWCGALMRREADFDKPDEHEDDCPWIELAKWIKAV